VEARALVHELPRVARNQTSGEYYVTDLFGLLFRQGKRVEVVAAVPPEDVLSINTPEQLAEVDRIYRARSGEVLQTAKGGAR
jgi:bifunctional UDP-N-acetylglucosamine pyrophosphorylase/glucosamine-1-phosphate N-acetyltransferase